jgi:hypothetical protein
MGSKVKIVNHRNAPVHLPNHVKPKEGGPLGRGETLHPGINEIDADVWDAVKNIPVVEAFLKDEMIEVGGRPAKDLIPTLKEFVESGYEPVQFKKRFPNATVADSEIAQEQMKWEAAKEAEEKAKKGQTTKDKK